MDQAREVSALFTKYQESRQGNLLSLHHSRQQNLAFTALNLTLDLSSTLMIYVPMCPIQPADIGWPTGNGKKLSNRQACCLAQLCLAEA